MGLTFLQVDVANLADPKNSESIEFLIDSGAIFSVVSAKVLEDLGIQPIADETFFLANGEKVVRRRGGAFFRYGEKVGVADVIFGEQGDSNLLGVTTLESLGLALDPLKRELKPMPMILGGWQSKA
jgi:predicted aspartyl protease